jgi:hypothetical protein
MNLDEFVKEVLIQIVSGVKKAQDSDGGAYIVPAADGGHEYAKHSRVSSNSRIKSTVVDFDIALTVEDSSGRSGTGGLKVFGFNADVQSALSSKDTTVSRIQFAIPIILPTGHRNRNAELGLPTSPSH